MTRTFLNRPKTCGLGKLTIFEVSGNSGFLSGNELFRARVSRCDLLIRVWVPLPRYVKASIPTDAGVTDTEGCKQSCITLVSSHVLLQNGWTIIRGESAAKSSFVSTTAF